MSCMKPTIPRARFDAFSDAVFAIAMTIMILELKVPALHGDPTNSEVMTALVAQIPVFAAYVASFAILAQLWISHSTLTKNTEEVPAPAAQFNMLFLFFVCLIPFPMALLSEFGFVSAVIIPYALLLAAASTTLGVVRASFLSHDEKVSKQRRELQRRRILVCFLVSLLGVLLTLFGQVSEWLSVLALVFVGCASLAYRFIK